MKYFYTYVYVTVDESKVNQIYPKRKHRSVEWMHSDSPPFGKVRTKPSALKIMTSVFWDSNWLSAAWKWRYRYNCNTYLISNYAMLIRTQPCTRELFHSGVWNFGTTSLFFKFCSKWLSLVSKQERTSLENPLLNNLDLKALLNGSSELQRKEFYLESVKIVEQVNKCIGV